MALLNDLFGIQSRGGCSCAGPYGHRLLGIDLEASHAFEREITRGCEGIKPGWVRVSFNYFLSDEVAGFLLDAVDWIAANGWKLLHHYDLDARTGLWRHEDGLAEPPLSLHDVVWDAGAPHLPHARRTAGPNALADHLAEADRVASRALRTPGRGCVHGLGEAPDDFEQLRWFPLPGEVAVPARA